MCVTCSIHESDKECIPNLISKPEGKGPHKIQGITGKIFHEF
jgi:hypothetical protein